MWAIGSRQALPVDDAGCFEWLELPAPEPGPTDLLVRPIAVAVNPIDAKLRGRIATAVQPPLVLGFDACGRVLATGTQVTGFRSGDLVMYAGDIRRPGCNAELQCIDFRLAASAPAGVLPQQAAAVPLVGLTAWESLFEHLAVPMGQPVAADDAVLLIGAAGGVGTMAIRLLRALTGQRVIATASSDASREWCLEQGAELVLDHRAPLPAQLRAHGVPAVPRILCMAPPNRYLEAAAEMLTVFGRLCCLADADERQPLQMHVLKPKSIAFHWEFMFARAQAGAAQMAMQGAVLARIAGLLEQGRLQLPAASLCGELSPGTLAEAHRQMENGHNRGKLVLTSPVPPDEGAG